MRLKQRQVQTEMTIMEYADSHPLHFVEWYLRDKRTLFVWFERVYCGYTVRNEVFLATRQLYLYWSLFATI